MAAQFIAMNGAEFRGDLLCIYLARTSLPVPLSPVINIGCGTENTIAQFAKIICKLLKNNNKLTYNLSYPNGTMRKILDSTIIRSLGWKPKIKNKDGLAQTINWYKNNYPK